MSPPVQKLGGHVPPVPRINSVPDSTALVFEETLVQTAFAVVTCAVPGLSVFYSLVVSILHFWARVLVFRGIRSYCFCSCDLRCCTAECVLLVGFNVQSDIFAIMIA